MKKLSILFILTGLIFNCQAQLTGNWGGFRDTLSANGIDLNATYSAMPVYNLDGGIKTGFRYIDNVDLTLNLNMEKLVGANGLSFFVYGLGNNGEFATELVGDIQTVSNIEAYPTWKLYEAWIQKNFKDKGLSFLAGLYDLNSEFDVVKPGLLFVHSSYGLGAELASSGVNGPSVFPVTSLAARVAVNIKKRTKIMAAVLDAVPGDPTDPEGTHIQLSSDEGALLIAQANINLGKELIVTDDGDIRKAGTIRRRAIGRGYKSLDYNQLILGVWRYTAQFETFDGNLGRGYQGAYVAYQRYFYLDAAQKKHITGFVRLGVSEDNFNQIGGALSGGIVTALPILGDNDEAGLAFSTAFIGEGYTESQQRLGNPIDNAETNIELTLNHRLLPYMAIQPSLQYVINPGADPRLDNALVFLFLAQVEL